MLPNMKVFNKEDTPICKNHINQEKNQIIPDNLYAQIKLSNQKKYKLRVNKNQNFH